MTDAETTTTVAAWDGIPAQAARQPLIKAPRAGDLVAAAQAEPVPAAPLRAA
jgi:hypothetical protein